MSGASYDPGQSLTEMSSHYDHLEQLPVGELLRAINTEDHKVPQAVAQVVPQIEAFVSALVPRMQGGGRLFYIGAGTSGRLGVVDASECPPTFGVPHGMVVGLMAGGDGAIRQAVEFAEDDETQAWADLEAYQITSNDTVVGIAASGRTPYVVGGLRLAQQHGLLTACITANPGAPVAAYSHHPIEVVVGPEVVTGSTRMKAGTAQKLVLNMISTATMVALGKVKGNKMVDMQLTNHKLVNRGTRMLMEALKVPEAEAAHLLHKHGSVRAAIDAVKHNAPD